MAPVEISGAGDVAKHYAGLAIKALLIIAILIAVWKVYKSVKAGATAAGEELGDVIVAEKTGIPAARVEVAKQVVEDMYSAYSNYWLGYNVDEEAWINALNRLVDERETALVSQLWRQKTSYKTLKQMVDESFNTSERQRLKPFILTNLS